MITNNDEKNRKSTGNPLGVAICPLKGCHFHLIFHLVSPQEKLTYSLCHWLTAWGFSLITLNYIHFQAKNESLSSHWNLFPSKTLFQGESPNRNWPGSLHVSAWIPGCLPPTVQRPIRLTGNSRLATIAGPSPCMALRWTGKWQPVFQLTAVSPLTAGIGCGSPWPWVQAEQW